MNKYVIILKKLGDIYNLNENPLYVKSTNNIEAGSFSDIDIKRVTRCIKNFFNKPIIKPLPYFKRIKMEKLCNRILNSSDLNYILNKFTDFIMIFSDVKEVELETCEVKPKHIVILSGTCVVSTVAFLAVLNSLGVDITDNAKDTNIDENKKPYSYSAIKDEVPPLMMIENQNIESETFSFGKNIITSEEIEPKIESATNILFNDLANLNLGYEYMDIKNVIENINGISDNLSLDEIDGFFKNVVEFNSIRVFGNALRHTIEYIAPVNLDSLFINNTKGVQGLKDLLYVYNSLNSNPYDISVTTQALNINYHLLMGNGLYKGLDLQNNEISPYIRLLAIRLIYANNAIITACNQVDSINVDGKIVLTSDLINCSNLDQYSNLIYNKGCNKTLKFN